MKKLLFLLLTFGLFSCNEFSSITPQEAYTKYGVTGGNLVSEYTRTNLFTGSKSCYVELDITDKKGNLYQRNVEVPSAIYWHAYGVLNGTYIIYYP